MAFGQCETCQTEATFAVYAAYDSEKVTEPHQTLYRYPGVMAYACDEHLSEMLIRDLQGSFSTSQWLVRRT